MDLPVTALWEICLPCQYLLLASYLLIEIGQSIALTRTFNHFRE